jgi:hypothetical protein
MSRFSAGVLFIFDYNPLGFLDKKIIAGFHF